MAKATDFRESAYRLGIPIRVREIEAEIRAYHRDYPELFLSTTPPLLLRPESRGAESSNGNGTGRPSSGYSTEARQRRERTAELLDWIAKHPRSRADMRRHGADMRGMHQLERYGYVTVDDGIYTRTEKAWVADRAEETEAAPKAKAKQPKPNSYTGEKRARRARSAKLLDHFDTETPKPPPPEALRAMGAYVRRGYLKQRGRGLYIRTAKPYDVSA